MIDISQELNTRTEELDGILEKYLKKSSSIQAITVVSPDGLPIASTSDENEVVIAAMTAASQSLSERVLSELERGRMQEIMLTGEEGFVVILNAGENAVVSFTAGDAKNIGLVRVLAKQLAKSISEMLLRTS
ncbi:MAG: roadblock/LC7 domain-containing protein [Candidatus Heimdallarchaeota archaeon]|nr:MAG: roadblock/LC7 domain-containing protein [Candidatus Heimdallarchaeota archaeon]